MARKRVWILAVLGLGLLGSVLCLMMRSPREQTEFVANCGDKKIPTGLYVMYEMLDATEAVIKQIVKNSNEGVDAQGDLKEHLRDVIDGKVVEDLIVEKTKECVTRHVEIDRLFDELGLTLSAEAEKKLEAAELAYNRQKEQLEKNGVGMRSFVDFFANKSKYDLICKAWFGPDGTQRPSKEALATFYDDNYVKLIVKPFPYDQTDESKQNQAQATLRFLDAAKSKGFGLVILEEGLEAAANSVPAVSVAAKPDDSNPVEPGQQQPEANEQSTNTAPSAPENDAGKTNQNATVSAVGKDATREKRIAELEKQHTVIVTKEQLLEWLTASGAAEANIAPYGVPFALNLQRPRQFLVAQKQPKTEEDLQENTEAVVLGMMKPVLDKQIDEKASRVQFSETVVAIFSPGCLRG